MENDFQHAKDIDKYYYYENFLSKHGNSVYAEEAQFLYAKSLHRHYLVECTNCTDGKWDYVIQGYQKYISKYPNGLYVNQAQDSIELITYQYSIRNENSGSVKRNIESLQTYIDKYPEGKYTNEVEERILYAQINDQDTTDYRETALLSEKYFEKYPKGKYLENIKQVYEQALWRTLLNSSCSQRTLEKYLSMYPHSKNHDSALEISKMYEWVCPEDVILKDPNRYKNFIQKAKKKHVMYSNHGTKWPIEYSILNNVIWQMHLSLEQDCSKINEFLLLSDRWQRFLLYENLSECEKKLKLKFISGEAAFFLPGVYVVGKIDKNAYEISKIPTYMNIGHGILITDKLSFSEPGYSGLLWVTFKGKKTFVTKNGFEKEFFVFEELH